MNPQVTMILSQECPKHRIIHPDGKCPDDQTEQGADNSMNSNDTERGPLVIDDSESEESERNPEASEFATSVIATQPAITPSNPPMEGIERNPTPRVELQPSQTQATIPEQQFGTTSRFQPFDQSDIFIWRGTSMSRQSLWHQIRTGIFINPEMREAFLQSEGMRQLQPIGQLMVSQPLYMPPTASLSTFNVEPPLPPRTQVPVTQQWPLYLQSPAYLSTPVGQQVPFLLPYIPPPPPTDQQPLSFDQSRHYTETRQPFRLFQGPHEVSMPSWDLDQTPQVSERSESRQHLFTETELQTALNQTRQEQQRMMKEMRILNQENMVKMQEEARRQQENFTRILETFEPQPSSSKQTRDSHPVRRESYRRSSHRSESRRREQQRTHVPRTFRDDRRTSIRSTKRSSTTNLANQPPQCISRMDASINREPTYDFSKSEPPKATTQSKETTRDTTSRQTPRTTTRTQIRNQHEDFQAPEPENDE